MNSKFLREDGTWQTIGTKNMWRGKGQKTATKGTEEMRKMQALQQQYYQQMQQAQQVQYPQYIHPFTIAPATTTITTSPYSGTAVTYSDGTQVI